MTPNLRSMKVKILSPTKDWILYQLSHSKKPIRYIVLYTIISAFQVLCLLHKSLIKINLLWLNPNSFFLGGSSLISLCWLQTTHYVAIQTASEWCQWIIIISPSKVRNTYYSCGMPSISFADPGSVTPTSHLNSFLGLQGIVQDLVVLDNSLTKRHPAPQKWQHQTCNNF